MKKKILKKAVSSALAAAIASSAALTAFAGTESGVNDFRVTDEYTALTYGSVNNAVLRYTGADSGITITADGASINTTEAFTLSTREDILDSVADYENAEFSMTVNAVSCERFAISADDGTAEKELYNVSSLSGKNVFSVKYSENTATLSVNDEIVKSETLAYVPKIVISGSNAVMQIGEVRYDEESVPETEAQAAIRASINASTDTAAMETALSAYLEAEGKADVYSGLPECDKTAIKNRMLDEKPFASRNELVNGYQKALEYATQADLDDYNKIFVEDFSNLDAGWTQTGVDEGAIGNGKLDVDRQSLPITDEDYSFFTYGGALRQNVPNYIERNVENPQSVITMYMKVVNNDALSFSATFDGSRGICLKNTGLKVHTLPNETIRDTGAVFQPDIWNKITFDGTEAGKVKCYINGDLAAAFDGSITKLSVGTIFDFASFSVIAVDNITIAEPKTAQECLAEFNKSEITESSLTRMLAKTDVKSNVIDVLPACDKNEIVSRMEKERPFADIDVFKTSYQKILEYTTQADIDNYNKVWSEDFSQGLGDNWTVVGTLKNNAVGTEEMIGSALPRKSLNISGTESASAGFVGASFDSVGRNFIERSINEKNTVVTLYFYDTMWDTYGYFHAAINDEYRIGLSRSDVYYTKQTGSDGWKNTNVTRSVGWHKIVFDGAAIPGTVTAYIDGVEVFRAKTDITKLSVGNPFADGSYYCMWVDNITVAEPKTAQEYLAKFNNDTVTADTLANMLRKTEITSDVFDVLPECDRNEIVSRMEKERPFADVDVFKTSYQKILEYTTQADLDNYNKVWSEDFSQGLGNNWTVVGTLKNNAVGTEEMIGSALPRKSLNISGTESASAGFVGASFDSVGRNFIERSIDEKNTVVTLYFYDTMYDTYGYFHAAINDEYRIGLSMSEVYYTRQTGSDGWKNTNVTRSVGWHKIVFDGTTSGIVTAYIDGIEVFQAETDITKLSVGNPFENGSYYCVWVDNITVSKSNIAESVKVLNKGTEIKDNKLPETANVMVSIENPAYETDYIAATYNGDTLIGVYFITKNEQKNGILNKDVSISGATKLKVFAWDDIMTMKPKTAIIYLSK